MRLFGVDLTTPAAQPGVGQLPALSAALNGPTESANISLAADATVLKAGAEQVYLIIDYSAAPLP
jgi:hypothetical protein